MGDAAGRYTKTDEQASTPSCHASPASYAARRITDVATWGQALTLSTAGPLLWHVNITHWPPKAFRRHDKGRHASSPLVELSPGRLASNGPSYRACVVAQNRLPVARFESRNSGQVRSIGRHTFRCQWILTKRLPIVCARCSPHVVAHQEWRLRLHVDIWHEHCSFIIHGMC